MDPRNAGLTNEVALQTMAEMKLRLEGMRASQEPKTQESLETPYLSYDELYPLQNGINLSLIRQSEKQFWQELVNSNIRAGTIACLWCLKAQAIKKLSVAFNKWKVFTALKSQELVQSKLKEMQQSVVVSSVIDNALTIIQRYKEGGIMNQVNGLDSRRSDSIEPNLRFPWENRHQYASEIPSAVATGLDTKHNRSVENNSDQNQEFFHASSSQEKISSTSIKEAMSTTATEWNFVRKQFQMTEKTDIESEREALLALSYDIIQRGQADKLSRVSSPPQSPRTEAIPPISKEVSKKSSLDLLQSEPHSPKSSQAISTEKDNYNKYSQSTRQKQVPNDDFEYRINEPFLIDSSPKNLTANGRFPENTLLISSVESLSSPPRFELQNSKRGRSADKSQQHQRKATKTPSQSSESKALNRSSRSLSPAATGRKPYSEKTLVDVIKFRKTKEGNYVKELLTPKEKREDLAQQSSFLEESHEFLHGKNSTGHKSGSKPRSVSPMDHPRYLMPTSARMKKMVSTEEAQLIKERQMHRQRNPHEPRGNSRPRNAEIPVDQQQHQNPPPQSHHHSPGYFPQQSFSYPHMTVSSSDPFLPSQNESDHHQQFLPNQRVSQTLSQENTEPKDPEYEYYARLLQEQQQQFLHYQSQTVNRSSLAPQPSLRSEPDQEYLSYKQYTNSMLPRADLPEESENLTSDFGREEAAAAPDYSQTQSQSQQPEQTSLPFTAGSYMIDSNGAPIYSLNPRYYEHYPPQQHPHHIVNQSFSSEDFRGRPRHSLANERKAKKTSPSSKKMDKAQRMLLFGVLHDVMDAKRAWERNLRR